MTDLRPKPSAPLPSVEDQPVEERERRPHFTQQQDTIPPQLLATWAAQASKRVKAKGPGTGQPPVNAERPPARELGTAASAASVASPPIEQDLTHLGSAGGVPAKPEVSTRRRWWLAVPALAILIFASTYGAWSKRETDESQAAVPERREPTASHQSSVTEAPRTHQASETPTIASTRTSNNFDFTATAPQPPLPSARPAKHPASAPSAAPAVPPKSAPSTASQPVEPPATPPMPALPTTRPPPAQSPTDIDLRAKILRRR